MAYHPISDPVINNYIQIICDHLDYISFPLPVVASRFGHHTSDIIIHNREQAAELLLNESCKSAFKRFCNRILRAKKSEIDQYMACNRHILHASMTLLDSIRPNYIFAKVLDQFFEGKRDTHTLCRIDLYRQVTTALEFIGVDTADFNITRNMFSRPVHHPMHGYSHMYRVMIACALIAHKINQPRLGLLAFIGAYIHDLYRIHDGNDSQHGPRAASHISHLCSDIFKKYKISETEQQYIANAVSYHSSDHIRLKGNGLLVGRILKDADALDRCRFRRNGVLDPNKLRFQNESRRCITPIRYCFGMSVYKNILENEIPFQQFVDYLQWDINDILIPYKESVPEWLEKYNDNISDKQLVDNILNSRVLYYPGAYLDGQPVMTFNKSHTVHSFILTDYILELNQLKAHFDTHDLAGYRCIAEHNIDPELFVDPDWSPCEDYSHNTQFNTCKPYCLVRIYEREEGLDDKHGAKRLALIYLGKDAIMSYDQIFSNKNIAAPYVMVLQDHGLGCNYDKFGANGLLNSTADKLGKYPFLMLVADGTLPWNNYSRLSYWTCRGGMHKNIRRLYVCNISKSFYDIYLKSIAFHKRHNSRFGFELKKDGEWIYDDIVYNPTTNTFSCLGISITANPSLTFSENLEDLFEELLRNGFEADF